MTVLPARTLPSHSTAAGARALLSAVLPGLGQLYDGRRRRGLVMIAVPTLGLLALGGLAVVVEPVAAAMVRRAALILLLVVASLFAFHVVSVIDAFAGRSGGPGLGGRRVTDYVLLLAVGLGLSLLYYSAYRHTSSWAAAIAAVFQEPAGRNVGAGTPSGGTTAPGWSGRERLNVLVLGIDTRDGGQTENTDTIIVLSIDPVTHTAAMLSIPRDTLVTIPGVGREKANAAYVYGGSPQEGADLARRTVEGLLGVPIHTWALIDFNAFRQTIDTVGGVIVDVRRPLRDESYPTADYGVERIDFLAGPQLMAGEDALRYARSRHESNDFGRARRQQQLLYALRSRLAQVGLFRLPSIVERVGPLVRTDFDPAGILPLARTVLSVETPDIRSEVLLPCGGDATHCELTEESSALGYYLVPDVAKVRALVRDLFAGSTPASAP